MNFHTSSGMGGVVGSSALSLGVRVYGSFVAAVAQVQG